ncbi:hypothetical protein VS884_26245, partial [Escherichia coli]
RDACSKNDADTIGVDPGRGFWSNMTAGSMRLSIRRRWRSDRDACSKNDADTIGVDPGRGFWSNMTAGSMRLSI